LIIKANVTFFFVKNKKTHALMTYFKLHFFKIVPKK